MGSGTRVLGRAGRGTGGRERSREALVERLDRDVDDGAQRLDELSGLLGLGSVLPAQSQRQADDDELRAFGRARARPARRRPASSAARSTTVRGRASVPVASEIATPVRAEP